MKQPEEKFKKTSWLRNGAIVYKDKQKLLTIKYW